MDDEQPPTSAADRTQAPEPAATDHPARERRHRHRTGRFSVVVGRGIATAAVVVAAVAGAGAIGVVAGLLTLFGWGAAIVVAILAVGVAAAIQPRPANGWMLVPVLALAVPSMAVAVSGVRVLPQRGTVIEAPATAAQIADKGYRAGLGDVLVDLRNLAADDGDRITVRAGSDLGRTVVALPQNQCFNLDVRWQTGSLRLPRVKEQRTVTGFHPKNQLSMAGQQGPYHRKRFGLTQGRIALFGRAYGDAQGRWVAPANYEGAPTLSLDLTSEGGSFVIRDYPDGVAPLRSADWPINQVPPAYPAVVRRQRLREELQRSHRRLLRSMRRQSAPTQPGTPTTPTAATTPTVPADPTATTAATAPTASADPTATTAATTATDPADPTAATTPTVPTAPADPTATTAATTPTVPADPAASVAATVPQPTRLRRSASPTLRSRSPASVVLVDRGGNLRRTTDRQAREWQRMAKRRRAFAHEWARRVAGACNRPGTFR